MKRYNQPHRKEARRRVALNNLLRRKPRSVPERTKTNEKEVNQAVSYNNRREHEITMLRQRLGITA